MEITRVNNKHELTRELRKRKISFKEISKALLIEPRTVSRIIDQPKPILHIRSRRTWGDIKAYLESTGIIVLY